jgi:hypothetical protein
MTFYYSTYKSKQRTIPQLYQLAILGLRQPMAPDAQEITPIGPILCSIGGTYGQRGDSDRSLQYLARTLGKCEKAADYNDYRKTVYRTLLMAIAGGI